jgi:tetratricopeptide (TPR) repeat protein
MAHDCGPLTGRPAHMRYLAVASLLLAWMALSSPALAARYIFGTKDYLNKIQDVDFKGPKGEALYLGHKYSHHSFIAPYSLSDGGYILGIVGQDLYYALDAKLIEQLQAEGKLPKPLPGYEISIWDYIFGHLLWIVAGGIIVAIVIANRGGARKKKALPFAQAGFENEQSGNLEQAIANYTRALDIDPKFAEILCRRAHVYQNTGAFDRAIADFSKVISAEPKHVMALLGRGSAFEAKLLTKQAIDDYSRAIRISKAGIAYYARAMAQLAVNDLPAAIKDFTAAIKAEPQFRAAYQNRGLAHERSGQQALAEADYKQAADLDAMQQAQQASHATSA